MVWQVKLRGYISSSAVSGSSKVSLAGYALLWVWGSLSRHPEMFL